MDIAPSGIAEKLENRIWITYDKIIGLTKIYLQYFEDILSLKNHDFLMNQQIAREISDNHRSVHMLLHNFKKAVIYTEYRAISENISDLSKTIKTMELYGQYYAKKIRSLKNKNTSPGIVISDFKNILFSLHDKIKDNVSAYVDTGLPFFSFSDKAWPQSSVLIGSLRNPAQLKTCIEHKFYHIPCSHADNPEKVKCIAVYQSKNLFDKDAGIKYYSRVISCKKVPRHMIKAIPKKSNEWYYIFETDKWKILTNPIKADVWGNVCIFTNLHSLLCSEKTGELLLDTKNEYDAYYFMKHYAFTPFCAQTKIPGGILVYNGEEFKFVKNGLTLRTVSSDEFIKLGVSCVKSSLHMLD